MNRQVFIAKLRQWMRKNLPDKDTIGLCAVMFFLVDIGLILFRIAWWIVLRGFNLRLTVNYYVSENPVVALVECVWLVFAAYWVVRLYKRTAIVSANSAQTSGDESDANA